MVATPGLAAAQPARAPDVAQGYALLHRGDRAAAIRHFTTLADAQPDHLGARFGRAMAELELIALDDSLVDAYETRLDALVDDAYRRHRAAPTDASAHFHLAQAYMLRATFRFEHDKGMWGAARDGAHAKSYSESYVARYPADTDALLSLGLYNYFADIIPRAFKILRFLLFLPSGDRDAGRQQIERAAAGGGPFAFRAQQILVEIYANLEGRPADALALAERRHAEYPQNDDVTSDLASLLASPTFEHRERAAQLYLAIIDRRARDTAREGFEQRYQAFLALAGVRADQWRLQEALDVLTPALAAAPRAPAWIHPVLRLRRGNYRSLINDPGAADDARAVLANAEWKRWHDDARRQVDWIGRRAASGEAAVYAALVPGNRFAVEGRWDDARRVYEEARARAPADPQAPFRIAHLRYLQGDGEGALKDLVRLANLRTAPAWLRAGAMLDVARTHDLAGRRDAAIRVYEQIVDDYGDERPAAAARLGIVAPYRRPAGAPGK